MQFEDLHWLSHHWLWAVMLYKYDKRTRDFLGDVFFFFSLVLYILGAFLLKTVIPLAVVGYEMIIANWVLSAASLVFTISCPTCARLWNIFSYFVFVIARAFGQTHKYYFLLSFTVASWPDGRGDGLLRPSQKIRETQRSGGELQKGNACFVLGNDCYFPSSNNIFLNFLRLRKQKR